MCTPALRFKTQGVYVAVGGMEEKAFKELWGIRA
jgi:hypothetical protein